MRNLKVPLLAFVLIASGAPAMKVRHELRIGRRRARGIRFFSVLLLVSKLVLVSAASTETESISSILQQVRIGEVPLVPNTGMSPPVALVHPAPDYTAEALQAGVEGTVTVRAEFDIDGNFRVLEVVDGLGHGLDQEALAVLQRWTFRPAYRSGRRVAVVANVDVEFRKPAVLSRDLARAYLVLVQQEIERELQSRYERLREFSRQ